MAVKKEFKVSDQSVNSYGLIVLTAGGKFERFTNNPVMLHLHDYSKLLGRWLNLRIDGPNIYATTEFNEGNDYAAERAQEVESDFLKGASIGIEPLKFEMGDAYGFPGYVVITEWELTEISLVPVPSNANALALYNNKGILMSETDIKEIKLSLQKQNTTEMKNRAEIIKALNLSADATDEDILNAINKQKKELSDANTAKEKAEANALEEKINLMVDAAVTGNKITAEMKPNYVKLAKLDFEGTKAILDNMKAATPPKPMTLVKEQGVTNENKTVEGRETWTYDDWATKDSKGLKLMKENNREQFDALLAAKKVARS